MFLPTLLILIFLILFGTMIRAGFSGAPWVPTFNKNLLASFKLADIKARETVYDLGCGDGRWLTAAARLTGAKKIIGVEISLLPYVLAQVRRWLSPNRARIKVCWRNFYQLDLSGADVIYIFSLPKVMAKLEPKFKKELHPGARVVSLAFKLPNYQPAEVFKATANGMPLYLYRF